jgi:hypothetical protein
LQDAQGRTVGVDGTGREAIGEAYARGARLVLHDDARLSRDELAPMPGHQPRADIVVARGSLGHHELDRLAFEELLRRLGDRSISRRHKQQRRRHCQRRQAATPEPASTAAPCRMESHIC